MKQATVKLPSGEYLIAEVPKGANGIYYDKVRIAVGYFIQDEVDGRDNQWLPPGNWQLLGADPTALTEEEAARVMDGYGVDEWRSYMKKPATASLDSLAASLGISKPYVILKLKTDNNDKH